MKAKFYCIIFFLTGYLFSSDNSTIPTHIVAGFAVQVVNRIESEPDQNGIQNNTFVPAEGNQVQEALDIVNNDENRRNDLIGAVSATIELDRQNDEGYITICYSNGDVLVDRLY